MSPDHHICTCANCDQSIEFPVAMAGQAAECPGCGVKTYLIAPAPASVPVKIAPPVLDAVPPVLAHPAPSPRVSQIEKVWGFSSGGCIAFFIGMCGISASGSESESGPTVDTEMRIAAIIIMIVAVFASRKHRCESCKGKVDELATVCPHCNCRLSSAVVRD